MLSKSRISRHMDMSRLGEGISRPGIDSRVWSSLAVALGDSVVEASDGASKGGVFVDIMLLPHGEEYTARVPADYAGNGFGFYAGKIHTDDEILVEAPGGDPTDGLVVTARLYSMSDPPSSDAVDNPDDVSLVVEEDHSLRLRVQGEGQVFISTSGGNITLDTGGGKVYLAENANGATPLEGVVNGEGIDPFTGSTYYALQNASTLVFAKKE